jgi:hypothetical protein
LSAVPVPEHQQISLANCFKVTVTNRFQVTVPNRLQVTVADALNVAVPNRLHFTVTDHFQIAVAFTLVLVLDVLPIRCDQRVLAIRFSPAERPTRRVSAIVRFAYWPFKWASAVRTPKDRRVYGLSLAADVSIDRNEFVVALFHSNRQSTVWVISGEGELAAHCHRVTVHVFAMFIVRFDEHFIVRD